MTNQSTVVAQDKQLHVDLVKFAALVQTSVCKDLPMQDRINTALVSFDNRLHEQDRPESQQIK